jgi:hypothetical protein
VTGKTVAIACRVVVEGDEGQAPAETVRRPNVAEPMSRKALENSGDPYVEQAKAIFGATIAKKDVTAAAAPEDLGAD